MATQLNIAAGTHDVLDVADKMNTTSDIVSIGVRAGYPAPTTFPDDVNGTTAGGLGFNYMAWRGDFPYQLSPAQNPSYSIAFRSFGVPVFSVPDGETWVVAPAGVADPDGEGSANWWIQTNKSGIARSARILCTVTGSLGSYVIETSIQQATTTFYDMISLGDSVVDGNGACSDYSSTPTNRYIDVGATFLTASNIWNDVAGDLFAPAGYYSDGIDFRYWNGLGSLGTDTNCTI